MSFRKAAALAASFLLLAAGAAFAQQRAPFTTLDPPQPTDGGGKVEVIEFFWYGCPHCYRLEPAVTSWLKTMPKDVVFKRVPAMSGEAWAPLASVYYTFEAMGLIDEYHSKIFDAVHKDNANLGNKKVREEWLAKRGIDVNKYNEVEKSFAVATKLQRGKQMSGAYRIDSVPQFVVNGKYVVTAESAGSVERIFPTIDLIIAMARKEKTARFPLAIELAQR